MGSETAFGGLAMWQTRGIGTNITKPIIARFSKKKINWWEIFSEKTIGLYTNPKAGKHLAVSLSDQAIDGYEYPMVSRVPTAALGELNEGDILQIMPDGRILRVYKYSIEAKCFIYYRKM